MTLNSTKSLRSKIFAFFICIILLFPNAPVRAQILASIEFDPKVDGFSFKNYRNENYKWDDDIAADDLIRLFGVKNACKSGTSAKNCVLKEGAARWMKEYLEAMDIGHCEGMSVASLKMKAGTPFKKRIPAGDFQSGAKSPFGLRFEQPMQNYIAYYWLTQTFDEVVKPTAETAAAGPVQIAKRLAAAMKDGSETYVLGIEKTEKNGKRTGHAVTPFAVEDTATQYKIHLYDNNFPGETRYLFINKTGAEQWTYNGTANPNEKPDYFGNKTSQTLDITANSWRENKCFRASFVADGRQTGCGSESALLEKPFFTNASFQKSKILQDETVEDAEFFLTDEGEMLITDANGDRLGYDPQTNRYYDEIPDSVSEYLIGGLGENLPHFTLPYEQAEEPYKVVFSGKYLDEESILDFVFGAPGFTVGFSEIRLDPNETLTATISSDGQEISFTASKDGETPEVFFAFDPEDDSEASYLTLIEGVELTAGKSLIYNFDFENGKLYFSDDDGNEDSYDIQLVRVNADGTRQVYTNSNVDIGKADRYEMDFEDWDGKGEMCFKDDEDGDGFGDEECTEEADDNTDGEFDN